MKNKWTILIVIIIAMLGVFIGCQKRESTKEEVYEEFQEKISTAKSYRCIADLEVIGNKSAHNYSFIHNYNKPDNYKLEVISPKHLRGKTMEYKGSKILVKNPNIDDIIELPNVGRNDQYLFVGDFIKNYLQNEEIEVNLSRGKLVLETYIPGDDEYFNKQVLYVNTDTKKPEKMEILDIKGKIRFTVNYKDFEYRK